MSLITTGTLRYAYDKSDEDNRGKLFWWRFLAEDVLSEAHGYMRSKNTRISPVEPSYSIVFQRRDPASGDWVECIFSHGTPQYTGIVGLNEIESCLLRDCENFLQQTGRQRVFGFTLWGTKMRCWVLYNTDKELRPLYGKKSKAFQPCYIDAHSDDAVKIRQAIEIMKSQ